MNGKDRLSFSLRLMELWLVSGGYFLQNMPMKYLLLRSVVVADRNCISSNSLYTAQKTKFFNEK